MVAGFSRGTVQTKKKLFPNLCALLWVIVAVQLAPIYQSICARGAHLKSPQ